MIMSCFAFGSASYYFTSHTLIDKCHPSWNYRSAGDETSNVQDVLQRFPHQFHLVLWVMLHRGSTDHNTSSFGKTIYSLNFTNLTYIYIHIHDHSWYLTVIVFHVSIYFFQNHSWGCHFLFSSFGLVSSSPSLPSVAPQRFAQCAPTRPGRAGPRRSVAEPFRPAPNGCRGTSWNGHPPHQKYIHADLPN